MIDTIKHDHRLAHIIGTQTKHAPNLLDRGTTWASWDEPEPLPELEVLVEKAPSIRRERRLRQRNLDAMGKKSRRKADRLAFEEKQNEQNLRGMARVQLDGRGTPAMRQNVERATCRFVEQLADDKGVKVGEARAEVESMLFQIGAAYGDLDDPRDAD